MDSLRSLKIKSSALGGRRHHPPTRRPLPRPRSRSNNDPQVGPLQVTQGALNDASKASKDSQEGELPLSVWDLKPWWCRPYSILSTGIGITAAVYRLSSGSVILTGVIGSLVLLWWYLFLIIYPTEYQNYLEESKQSNVED